MLNQAWALVPLAAEQIQFTFSTENIPSTPLEIQQMQSSTRENTF